MILQWQSFDCLTNRNVVATHKCFIVDPAKSLITAEVTFKRVLPQFNASIVLYLPRPPFKGFQKAFDTNVDICHFIRGVYQQSLVRTVYKSMTKYSNMPKKCPHPKGLFYYRNMSIGENLPSFLPKSNFKIQLDFFLPGEYVINVTLSGRL
ncbi:hypothetical protein KR222_006603, partial [Zaprionus bogoriensis]